MLTYNGKAIFQGEISKGNRYREEYLNSVNCFIENKYLESFEKRNLFMKDIVENQEAYRKSFINMIGEPVSPYPTYIPCAKREYIGTDDLSDIYYMQIETMPEFWFFGIFMVPHNAKKAPLVIAQHGGGSTPEI